MTKQGSGKGTNRGAATLPSQSILSGLGLRVDANVKRVGIPVPQGLDPGEIALPDSPLQLKKSRK
jgi:hypothetical protein